MRTGASRPSETKVLDYIYGVLHSPIYRRDFEDFLKIDFPRIPFPASHEVFAHFSDKGEELRRLHLMEAAAVGDASFSYHGEGTDVVAGGFPRFDQDRIYINPDQYFSGVPITAWNLEVGGYHPTQKWLKDRRGRVLSWEDVTHFQRIIKVLQRTHQIVQDIDLPTKDL
jgi:predicted helicase